MIDIANLSRIQRLDAPKLILTEPISRTICRPYNGLAFEPLHISLRVSRRRVEWFMGVEAVDHEEEIIQVLILFHPLHTLIKHLSGKIMLFLAEIRGIACILLPVL